MSGFRGDDLYLAEQTHLSAAAGTNAVASLQAGHPFSLLLAEDDRQRSAALEALLDTIADPATRFARVTNPLRARLTLERMLIQLIQTGVEDLVGDDAAIIRRIAERRQTEDRVILVIEQAETLHPEVLRFLGRTAAMFPDGTPRLQVLFVGRPSLHPLLDNPDAGFDEQTAMLESYRPAVTEPAFAAPAEATADYVPAPPLPQPDNSVGALLRAVWGRGLPTRLAIIGGTTIGIAAVAFAVMLAVTAPPEIAAPDAPSALSEMPEPGAGDPDPPVLQAGPAPDAETAAMRQEFETYLIASGKSVETATAAQKRAIYNEFLVWRARTRAPRPSP